MSATRWQLGGWAIASLVLLRLCIGWHFYREGTAKLAYDADARQYRIAFSAEGFLRGATGPLAGTLQSFVPTTHDWQQHLAVPRQIAAADEEQPADPAAAWREQIVADWWAMLKRVNAMAGLSEDQSEQAADALERREKQLEGYLEQESDDIAEYQHELWRLENWQSQPEADGVPFQENRIATTAAQLRSEPLVWVRQVQAFEAELINDLRNTLTDQQQDDPGVASAFESAVADPGQRWLDRVNVGVTSVTIGVGVCLLLGLFTRLASLVGALFLLSVMASQPPWVSGANTDFFLYQLVELAAFVVIATTGAGRWFGLDFFTHTLCQKCCRRSGSQSTTAEATS